MIAHQPFSREVPAARVCVLMVHGILGSPHHFDMLLPYIPEDWSFRSLQLDGHGGKVRDFRRTSREKWEAQVEREVADACASYERVVIVAHSMGCMLTANAVVKLHLEHKIGGMLFLGAALYPKCDPPVVRTAVRMLNFPPDDGEDACVAAARRCCGVDVYKTPLCESNITQIKGLSFRASAHAGVGISRMHRVFSFLRGLPHQRHRSLVRNDSFCSFYLLEDNDTITLSLPADAPAPKAAPASGIFSEHKQTNQHR